MLDTPFAEIDSVEINMHDVNVQSEDRAGRH